MFFEHPPLKMVILSKKVIFKPGTALCTKLSRKRNIQYIHENGKLYRNRFHCRRLEQGLELIYILVYMVNNKC